MYTTVYTQWKPYKLTNSREIQRAVMTHVYFMYERIESLTQTEFD